MTLNVLVLMLGLIVVLSNFLDFLIGEAGTKKLRDRLAAFYVRIDDAKWSEILRTSLVLTDRYLSAVFGEKILSLRFLLVGAAISFVVSAMVTLSWITLDAVYYPNWTVAQEWRSTWDSHVGGSYLITFAINCLFDLGSFLLIRYWLRHLSTTPTATAVAGFLVASAALGYLCVCLASAVALPFVRLRVAWQTDPHPVGDWLSKWVEMAPVGLEHALAHPFNSMTVWGAPPNEHNYSLFLLTSAFGTWVQFAIILVVFLIWISRSFLKVPILLITRRLEESPKGLFTILGLMVSAVIGLLNAYAKV